MVRIAPQDQGLRLKLPSKDYQRMCLEAHGEVFRSSTQTIKGIIPSEASKVAESTFNLYEEAFYIHINHYVYPKDRIVFVS